MHANYMEILVKKIKFSDLDILIVLLCPESSASETYHLPISDKSFKK